MWKWLRKLFTKKLPREQDPLDDRYWRTRGYPYPNTMALSYHWGLIDAEGKPMPEPYTARD